MAHARDAVLVTEAEPVNLAEGGPRILYVNEAFTRMTGYTAEEAVGRTPRMLQSPHTDQRELDRLRTALRRWEPVEVELRNVRKDGQEFWVQFIIAPVMDDAGWYTHWVSIQRDVSTRRRRDDDLVQMVRATAGLSALVHPDGRIHALSPGAEATLAGPQEELIGSDALELVHTGQRDRARRALRALGRPSADGRSSGEIRLHTRDGWRWFEVTASAGFAEDRGRRIVLAISDVTQRRRARAELQEARRRFHGAFTDAPVGVAVLARDGALLQVNAQLCRLAGLDEASLLAFGLDDLVHADDRPDIVLERAALLDRDLTVGRREARLLRPDGRMIGVMLSSSLVRAGDVEEFVVHIEDISERKALEARLTHDALHDSLTRLPNRALFLDRLHTALRRADRTDVDVSVLFVDLDGFKAVNDLRGHEAGDLVLRAVASRLTGLVRGGDAAARLGGDEFTILCDETDRTRAESVAQRVASAIEIPIPVDGEPAIHVRASIGIASTGDAATTADELLRNADMAMYAAKDDASVRYEVFDDRLRSRTLDRLGVEQDLRRALDAGELELHYQPLYGAAATHRPVAFEALVRWRHPERGLLQPGSFVPAAESSELILEIDRWVLRRACEDAARLPSGSGKVWVNVSLRSLDSPILLDDVLDCLRATGTASGCIGLEITERAVVEGGDQMRENVEQLSRLGIEFAADDFGTGYSSLAALIERPVDVLKIDRSFVSELPGVASAAVVEAIVAMASALGLRTVAEGVEFEKQLDSVRELGCDEVQGFLLGRAVPFATLLRSLAQAGEPVAGTRASLGA